MCCYGLRLSKNLKLQLSQLDFENRIIYILHAKNNKYRLIPTHDTVNRLLINYCSPLKIYGIEDALLFHGKKKYLSQITAERHFKIILRKAEIINEDHTYTV